MTTQTALQQYLSDRLSTDIDPDLDLFASGLVTSLFAMELVVHLEQQFDIEVVGPDLKLDNFRSVRSMSDLVLRLRSED